MSCFWNQTGDKLLLKRNEEIISKGAERTFGLYKGLISSSVSHLYVVSEAICISLLYFESLHLFGNTTDLMHADSVRIAAETQLHSLSRTQVLYCWEDGGPGHRPAHSPAWLLCDAHARGACTILNGSAFELEHLSVSLVAQHLEMFFNVICGTGRVPRRLCQGFVTREVVLKSDVLMLRIWEKMFDTPQHCGRVWSTSVSILKCTLTWRVCQSAFFLFLFFPSELYNTLIYILLKRSRCPVV